VGLFEPENYSSIGVPDCPGTGPRKRLSEPEYPGPVAFGSGVGSSLLFCTRARVRGQNVCGPDNRKFRCVFLGELLHANSLDIDNMIKQIDEKKKRST